MASRYLLDTNIITGILKRDARVVNRLRQALAADAQIILSPVVFYELKRGLLKKDARKQLRFLEELLGAFHWEDLRRPDWETAAEAWARDARQGRPRPDMDLLIATHARRFNAIVVTANTADFTGLGLTLENWVK